MESRAPFVRNLSGRVIGELQGIAPGGLYRRLLVDAKAGSGAIFPAIRDNSIDFYFSGGKLFTYKNGDFSTHQKYASVIADKKGYVKEADIKKNKVTLIKSFCQGYKRIKENCALYSGVESRGVGELYGCFSYVRSADPVVVLDIEIALEGEREKESERQRSYDRIDLLLYDTVTSTLRFYEAKHYSNSEIWAERGSKPKVIEQVKRYERQVEARKPDILQAYCRYVELANDLFGLRLPEPQIVDPYVGLIIFGFDKNQLQGRFSELLLEDGSLNDVFLYKIGDISKVDINNLWKNTLKPVGKR